MPALYALVRVGRAALTDHGGVSRCLTASPAVASPGSFTTTEVFGGFGAAAVADGDFDGKNGPDLAIANFVLSGVSMLLNNGDGTVQPGPDQPADHRGRRPGRTVGRQAER